METILPYTLIWNPLTQFQPFFRDGVQCPKVSCGSKLHLGRWNVGHSDGHCPRFLHELNHIVILLPALYRCDNDHELLSTDPYILRQLPEEEYIPFSLFHRSGVTREFARTIIGLCIQGLSFSAMERFVQTRRKEYIATLQLKINCITPHIGVHYQSLTTLEPIRHLYQPYPPTV